MKDAVEFMPEKRKEEDIVTEIKNEDKRLRGKYILLLIACFVGGGLFGLLLAGGSTRQKMMEGMSEMLGTALMTAAPYMVLLFAILAGLIVTVLYRQARKLYASWDGEEEALMKQIEGRLSIAILVVGVETILFFLFTIIFLVSMEEMGKADDAQGLMPRLVVYLAGFILMMVSQIFGQQKIVNMEKEMNPEKKGSVYDVKFQKKWLDSCDEAEQMAIYKAGFASCQMVNKLCMVLMFVNMAGIMFWNWGMVPAFMIAIIWLVSLISYCVKADQLSK